MRARVKDSAPILKLQCSMSQHVPYAGEAVSNAVQAAVGELAWTSVATACTWNNESSGETLRLFDPDLTARGEKQVLQTISISLQQAFVSDR